MAVQTISPADALTLIDNGARLVDIRGADEHARERIPGAINVPLDRIGDLPTESRAVVFHCKTGMRTAANEAMLGVAAGAAPVYILEGGIEGWRQAGLPTVEDRAQPIEIMRQVQITAGALVVIGVLLGLLVAPGFLGLTAFVGAGLMFAGVSGWCGMANILRLMPWNRRLTA